jgi:hypothetical protein
MSRGLGKMQRLIMETMQMSSEPMSTKRRGLAQPRIQLRYEYCPAPPRRSGRRREVVGTIRGRAPAAAVRACRGVSRQYRCNRGTVLADVSFAQTELVWLQSAGRYRKHSGHLLFSESVIIFVSQSTESGRETDSFQTLTPRNAPLFLEARIDGFGRLDSRPRYR